MTTKQKIGVVVLLVVITAVGLYFWFKEPEIVQDTNLGNPINPNPVVTNTTAAANDNFPLVKGSAGDRVKSIQTAINKINPNAKLTVDGVLGTGTYTAIVTYVGTKYYPVTTANFMTILQKSQQV
jgi:hypothetical protein